MLGFIKVCFKNVTEQLLICAWYCPLNEMAFVAPLFETFILFLIKMNAARGKPVIGLNISNYLEHSSGEWSVDHRILVASWYHFVRNFATVINSDFFMSYYRYIIIRNTFLWYIGIALGLGSISFIDILSLSRCQNKHGKQIQRIDLSCNFSKKYLEPPKMDHEKLGYIRKFWLIHQPPILFNYQSMMDWGD